MSPYERNYNRNLVAWNRHPFYFVVISCEHQVALCMGGFYRLEKNMRYLS